MPTSDTLRDNAKVTAAVRTTSSFIYGTSTLLGQEGSLDYLLAIREYVQERIRAEAESWRPERAKAVKEYTDSVQKRVETERILARVCRESMRI